MGRGFPDIHATCMLRSTSPRAQLSAWRAAGTTGRTSTRSWRATSFAPWSACWATRGSRASCACSRARRTPSAQLVAFERESCLQESHRFGYDKQGRACRLPSFNAEFTASTPLTRIRDIAHRSDIPHDLKQEIKHTIQASCLLLSPHQQQTHACMEKITRASL